MAFKPRLAALAAAAFLAAPAALSAQPAPSTPRQGQPGNYQTPSEAADMKTYQGLKSEQRFMVEAYMGNTAEVSLGQLAEQKGQSRAVKDYGRTLTQDHGRANQTVTEYLNDQQVSIPNGVTQDHLKAFTTLNDAKASEFDKAFATIAVQEHQKEVDKYTAFQKKAGSQEVKDYINQTLPVLKQHLQQAKQLQKDLGGKA